MVEAVLGFVAGVLLGALWTDWSWALKTHKPRDHRGRFTKKIC